MTILDRMAREVGVNASLLAQVVRTSDHRYMRYTIPKAKGGVRLIAHPSRELKFIQRWLVSNVFSLADIHEAATAFRPGSSTAKNALLHIKAKYVLRIDFRDFFASITTHDIEVLLRKILTSYPADGLTEAEDILLISKAVTRFGTLPIGAPSSPIISNAVLFEFDGYMANLAQVCRCGYSRYADDLVFSTREPDVLSGVLREVRSYVGTVETPRLIINEDKVSFVSKKRRVLVTGLTLTAQEQVSVGRATKRKIKGYVHRFLSEQLSDAETSYLIGYLAYLRSVEPAFLHRLEAKYGREQMERLYGTAPIRRKRPYGTELALLEMLLLRQQLQREGRG